MKLISGIKMRTNLLWWHSIIFRSLTSNYSLFNTLFTLYNLLYSIKLRIISVLELFMSKYS